MRTSWPVLTPIWHQKPETARRVKQRIAAVMKWCIAQGFRQNNPADERITAALGTNTQRPQHMKALHHSQVAAAVRTVEATDAHWATIAAFKYLTFTATRSGEVRNATWDEIDLATATWTVPPEHTKTGLKHRVPLSTSALTVLGGCSHVAGIVIDHGVWQRHAVTDINNIIRDSAACTTAMGGSHE